MKNRNKLGIVLAFAVALSAFSGCSFSKAPSAASSAPASSQVTESSQAVSSVDSSSAQSEAAVSSVASVSQGNQPTESQPGQVIAIETDDKAFDKLFKANPIDKAYIKESNNAFSNVDMVNVSNKYSGIWQKEITYAFDKLDDHLQLESSKKPKQLQTEQEEWEIKKAAALKKITEEEQAKGGSMAQVNVASKVMDFYRSRAAQIYKELYVYDKKFSYAYKN